MADSYKNIGYNKESPKEAAVYYYLIGDKNLQEVAKELGISKRTLQNYIKAVEGTNKELYDAVRAKQEETQKVGRIKGGKNGKRGLSYSPEDAQTIVDFMKTHQATYDFASAATGIPRSTIYEMVHGPYVSIEDQEELDRIAAANRRHIITENEKGNRKPQWDDTGKIYENPPRRR